MRGWATDLVLGLRLAVGGGRSSLVRFVLSTLGIAIAVAVLLLAASIGTMVDRHDQREVADQPDKTEPVAGVDPLYIGQHNTEFRGESVEIYYVYAEGDAHPLPDGVDRLPAPGEVLASPALADLLASPDGELLRPRLPGPIVGTLGQEIVVQPTDLKAWIGADAGFAESANSWAVYEFGESSPSRAFALNVLLLVLVGGVALLLPVLIFVSSTSRIAGAERDRRLAALRLVGAGARQVRRIAAAESVVSALAGLVVGGGLFLYLRTFADEVELFGTGVYESDVVPEPVLVVLIVLVIPALAVLTALFALRSTIIEPLGVVRRAKPVRRRVWWRLALVAAGVAILFTGFGASRGSPVWAYALAMGATMLLVGVPVLLPWLVERVAGRIRGGPSSWQLAVRRLQLDSGTSARVVGGIAVVLAGAIALQAVVLTVENTVGVPAAMAEQQEAMIEVSVDEDLVDAVQADLAAVPSVRGVHLTRSLHAYQPGVSVRTGGNTYIEMMDCAAVRAYTEVEQCADGDVIAFPQGERPVPEPGTRLEFRDIDPKTGNEEVVDTWQVPDSVRNVSPELAGEIYASAIVTTGALAGVELPDSPRPTVRVSAGNPTSDELERIRNAVAGYTWQVNMFSLNTVQDLTNDQRMVVAIRNGLYAGSVFTLLLAGVSLLVLALEHIRERRRPLAMLVASGVQRGVIARSLLWQVALPIVLGLVVAVLTGVGLAWLIVRLVDEPFSVDWAGVGVLSASAALLSILVTALTLPFLRSATRLTSLRTE